MNAAAQWKAGFFSSYQSNEDDPFMIVPIASYETDWLNINPLRAKLQDPLPPFLDVSLSFDWSEYFFDLLGSDNAREDPQFNYIFDSSVMLPLIGQHLTLRPAFSTELSDIENRYWGSLTLSSFISVTDNFRLIPEVGYFYHSKGEWEYEYLEDGLGESTEPGARLLILADLTENISLFSLVSYQMLPDDVARLEEVDSDSETTALLSVNYEF